MVLWRSSGVVKARQGECESELSMSQSLSCRLLSLLSFTQSQGSGHEHDRACASSGTGAWRDGGCARTGTNSLRDQTADILLMKEEETAEYRNVQVYFCASAPVQIRVVA
jgi:hypothetical protein